MYVSIWIATKLVRKQGVRRRSSVEEEVDIVSETDRILKGEGIKGQDKRKKYGEGQLPLKAFWKATKKPTVWYSAHTFYSWSS